LNAPPTLLLIPFRRPFVPLNPFGFLYHRRFKIETAPVITNNLEMKAVKTNLCPVPRPHLAAGSISAVPAPRISAQRQMLNGCPHEAIIMLRLCFSGDNDSISKSGSLRQSAGRSEDFFGLYGSLLYLPSLLEQQFPVERIFGETSASLIF
jgi:hypothetical protein